MAEIIASLHDAGKKFFFHRVLKNINLEVKKGEILGLIGPSGSGKTTCIRCMLGMEDLTEGEAFVLNEQMPKRKVLDRTGYMGQETALYGTLTAYENMVFFGQLKNLSKETLQTEIDKNLKLVDLYEYRNKVVTQFSGSPSINVSLVVCGIPILMSASLFTSKIKYIKVITISGASIIKASVLTSLISSLIIFTAMAFRRVMFPPPY